jgi:hypothetical protein
VICKEDRKCGEKRRNKRNRKRKKGRGRIGKIRKNWNKRGLVKLKLAKREKKNSKSKFLPCSGGEWVSSLVSEYTVMFPSNFWSSGFCLQFSHVPSGQQPSITVLSLQSLDRGFLLVPAPP